MFNFYVLKTILPFFIGGLLLFSSFVSAQDKVVLQLKWKHQFQFAGYYAAKEMGFYQEAGFDVELRERDPSTTPIDEVLNGNADFGVSDSSLILHRMKGKPVVVLGAIFQHSPLVLMTRASDKLLGPYELIGKRVMYQKGVDDAVLTGMFHELGLSDKDIIHVPQNFDPRVLLTGEVDAMSAYATNEPYYYEQEGIDVHLINPLNYGIDFYDDMLFTTQESVHQNPQRALRFLNASVRGWKYALEYPDEVIGWIKDIYGSEKSLAHLKFESIQTEKMILPNWVEIGNANVARFQRIGNIYRQLGKVPQDAELTGIALNEYLIQDNELPHWVKAVMIGGVLSLLLAIAFLIIARHFRNLVQQRTSELDQANSELGRYIGIVDQYVISSQTDMNGLITNVSNAFCQVSGYAHAELLGKPHNIVRHPETTPESFTSMWEELKQGDIWSGICKNQKKDGSTYWVELNIDPIINRHNKTIGYLSVGQDISDKKRIEQLSITDKLTGLYNRLHLDIVLEKEINRIGRYGGLISVILCDIDHFKAVNDTYGHLEGDSVLLTIANMIKDLSRNSDIVGRWGGEEFVIVCPNTTSDSAKLVAEKLRSEIGAFDFSTVGKQTCSFGVATASCKRSATDIINAADIALYKAKDNGRNRVEVNNADVDTQSAEVNK